mmetsp:Transcript_37576/g.69524  ORF Transcript_37576/g.69524 Transcript_37576/m.69524 type:complete len:310 (-) Transcript_37576:35-964(-)|eukprot:CAMPEP_0196132660 /NCGR_PEP_ID=MMETSP0910-20130528/2184_1 /TAXON_ID=49265 /ORGANISM="Thalassiosira rotula, Strain GSO102" /LENGTH=309 /DNA_ID=CAMNT_0041392283 /DNA_START=118 /DNA_END=1047 /DNA_ORIENTATION=+
MEDEKSRFTMPAFGADDADSIANIFQKIQEGMDEYQRKQELGPRRGPAKTKTPPKGQTPFGAKTTLFCSQLKIPPVVPSTDEYAARRQSSRVGDKSASASVAKFSSEDSRHKIDDLRRKRCEQAKLPQKPKKVEPWALFNKATVKKDFFDNVWGSSCDQAKLPQKPKEVAPLTLFDKPSSEKDFFGDIWGKSGKAKLPQEPKVGSLPLKFDKPTFAQDFFSKIRDAQVDARKTGKRKSQDEGVSVDATSGSRKSTPNSFCSGFGSSFSCNKPTKDEVDDFIAFADKWIPSIKRRKTEKDDLGGGQNDEK